MEANALAQLLVALRPIVWAVTGRPAAAAAAVATFQHCRQALHMGKLASHTRRCMSSLDLEPSQNLCSALMVGDKCIVTHAVRVSRGPGHVKIPGCELHLQECYAPLR